MIGLLRFLQRTWSCLFRSQTLSNAVASFQQAIRLKPNYVDAHYNLGFAYVSTDRKNKALQEYTTLLSIDKTVAQKLYEEINKMSAEARQPSTPPSANPSPSAGTDAEAYLVPSFIITTTYYLALSKARRLEWPSKPEGFSLPKQSPYRIVLTSHEHAQLEARTRKYTSPYRDVIRAKIVLLAAQGLSNDVIAARLDTPRQIVSKWRKRFALDRLLGLEEQPRGGRPTRFSPQSHRAS